MSGSFLRGARVVTVVLAASFAAGCGYHVAGHNDALPKSIHVIAIPSLENKTTGYRIEQKLTGALVREFLAKTRYKIVSSAGDGDAVLRGTVVSLEATPLLFDTASGSTTATGSPVTTARATTMLVTVRCDVTLTETSSQKVLYHNENLLFRNEYEISTDVKSFFEEQDPALDRLAQDFAASVVSAVIENY